VIYSPSFQSGKGAGIQWEKPGGMMWRKNGVTRTDSWYRGFRRKNTWGQRKDLKFLLASVITLPGTSKDYPEAEP